jgi:GTP cyclohydrolase I
MNQDNLPDTQNGKDIRGIHLPKVGIRNFLLPLQVTCEHLSTQTVPAKVSAYTDLNASVKGINMSRIAEVIQPIFEEGLRFSWEEGSQIFIQKILEKLVERLKATDSYVKIRFPVFFKKKSPKSEKTGFSHYECVLEGIKQGDEVKYFMEVKVQYISCCSCSKELSKHLEENGHRGAPHNQRSFAEVKVELDTTNPIGIRQLIKIIENAVKTLPYPLIKRIDEQEIARRSWYYTQFVEDSSRNIGLALMRVENILDWVVVVNHEESIHQHDAVAILYKGIEGGLR